MKKRVRLYKAQEGGMPNVDEMGYPGQQQTQEVDDNQLASSVLTDISNSEPRERIIIKLVNTYGKDPMEAQQFVDQMYQYVEKQKQDEIDNAEEEEDDSDAVTMGQDTVEEAEIEEVEEGPTGTEMSNTMIAEDDVEDDDSEVASNVTMRYGGYPRAQEGMEVPIEMPDVSAYLPQDMADYLGGTTNPYSGLAWDKSEMMEDAPEEEEVFSDYTESMLPEERFGGMPSKRSYVNSVLKLAKKQMGGDSAAPKSAEYNDDNADPTGSNVRKKSLDKFIGAVKNQSSMALAKQQAEQQYEQMMQQQQMMQQYPMAQQGGQQPGQGDQNIYQGQDYENPMHHLALFSQSMGDVFQEDENQINQAQIGGSVNNPFADEYGNLQQFIGGGDEDFTQGDLDDVYSKDTANGDFPMAQWGGGIDALFPANIMPTRYAKMKGVPYDPRTGKTAANFIPGKGTNITGINIDRYSLLGRPKKFTITYGTREMDPRKQNLIPLPGSGTQSPATKLRQVKEQRTDIPDDLSLAAKMAINRGDRQTARNDRRLARNPQYANYANVPQVDDFTPEELYNKRITSSREPFLMNDGSVPAYNPTVKGYGPGFQYGGDLNRFIPQAENGMESPVVYTNNPAMNGMAEVDMVTMNPGIQGLGNSTLTSFMNTNVPARDQSKDQKQYTVDPTQIGSQQAKNVYQGPKEDVSVDYKVKNLVDPEAALNVANAGITGITGLINRAQDQRAEAKMADNLTADNLYASDPSLDRGDYDTNSGLYRPDEMGQKWNSRSKQYGGNIYQDGGMVEGDELDMTEEEVEEFLANGGELEYL